MSKICKITGKRPLVGNNVSKANNKTKRRQLPNLQNKKIFVPELGKSVRIKVSTSALKSIDKEGLMVFLKKKKLTLSDIL
ncbi:MAG: 50S ribosomal protein L28 [Candidatus Marinimicrobia bacterium]|jgi:large subunit ribosomal protein L28|nr:50S ribosomal protein L28 [Candidatus Neomarinimicrobiota bacterium]|tara:strand:- start:1027 stop:1266 length:240 start_codon:yes stop_codon:yes gene_type:complete